MKTRRIDVLTVFLWMQVHSLFAGKYANAFLEIGIGPRALAMGGAFCAVADDGHAFYWNPAGMALLNRSRISAMYAPQFGHIDNPLANYHFIGYVQPMPGDVVVGIQWIRLTVDKIAIYSELEGKSFLDRLIHPELRPTGESEGYLNDVEDAYFFSFAKRNTQEVDLGWAYGRIRMDFPFGVNIKWIRQRLGDYSATGLGVDLGFMVRMHVGDVAESEKWGIFGIGMHFQDMTRTTMRWNTRHNDAVPMNLKWGISYGIPLPFQKQWFLIAFDQDTRYSGRTHFGVEYQLYRKLSLRGGLDNGRFSGGMGLTMGPFEIHYAILTHSLDTLHRIGCAVTF